jgi:phosphatidylserine/phosphatidylglycerophosphate/cardiolipin synthase-like enzyme
MRMARNRRARRRLRWAVPLAAAAYAGLAVYYRYRPLPPGVNGVPRSYRIPASGIRFYHDTTWYEDGQRACARQITPEVIRIIGQARRFVVMDVFLFSHHHLDRDDEFIPTTRQIVDALAAKDHPAWFITDPINTTYGTAVSAPIRWLEEAGVPVCITDVRKLRDSTLLYSPLWRLTLQWFGNDAPPRFRNPFEPSTRSTPWAFLEAATAHANHRKLVIADDEEDYVTLVTSSNFEDASCYFGNTALTIRGAPVASHFLEAEKALARASGMEIPVQIPSTSTDGDAKVTPLMGDQIKRALLADLNGADSADRLYLFAQFLSNREVIEALVRASQRGVRGTLVLDQNKVNFGQPKNGFPNQLTAPELARRTDLEVRWANTRNEEFHNQFLLLQRPASCVIHVGAAKYTRRSLGNMMLESNVRVEAPRDAGVCRQALDYARWLAMEPRSLPFEKGRNRHPWPLYWVYRFQEATGSGKF